MLPGGDVTRAGTRMSAGGTVSGTAKKGMAEVLDNQIADLNKDCKAAGGPPKNPKKRDPKDDEAKKLQKDIKA